MPGDLKRFQELYSEFARALMRLEEVCTGEETEVIRDARIQRFEFTFELAWKTLRACLQILGVEANNPRQAFKEGFSQGLIANLDQGDVFLAMLEDRNLTVHTYKSELAIRIAASIRTDYLRVLRALSESLLKWSPP